MSKKKMLIKGRGITSGVVEGEALVTHQSFGFAHGLEPATGRISDDKHEWIGQNVKGKVLVFPYGKGSVSAGLYVLEAARQGNAPVAVINLETDPVVATGFLLAKIMYGREIPVMDRLERNPMEVIKTGDWIKVDATTGVIEV